MRAPNPATPFACPLPLPPGSAFIAGSYDGCAKIWRGGAEVVSVQAHDLPVKGVALLSPAEGLEDDGGIIRAATGAQDGSVRLWALRSRGGRPGRGGHGAASTDGELPRGVGAAHAGSVESLAARGDCTALCSGGFDGAVYIWRIDEAVWDDLGDRGDAGSHLPAGNGHADGVDGVEIKAGVVKASGAKRQRLTAAQASPARSASPIVPALALLDHTQPVVSLAWPAHGQEHVLSGSWDGSIRAWDANTGSCVHTAGSLAPVQALAAASGAVGLVATGHDNGVIQLWDLRTPSTAAQAGRLSASRHWVAGLAFCTALPHMLAAVMHDGCLRVWDVRGAHPVSSIAAHEDKSLCVAWGGKAGRTMATGGADCSLKQHALPGGPAQ